MLAENGDGPEIRVLAAQLLAEQIATGEAPVRALHDLCGAAAASGDAEVIRGASPLAKLICALVGLPPTGRYTLTVYFHVDNGVEKWTPHFGRHCFASVLSQAHGRLVERFGPVRFNFDLPSTEQGLCLEMRGWSIFHLKMPLWLAPRTKAREWAQEGEFNLDVRMQLPLVGPLVQYRGRLRRNPR